MGTGEITSSRALRSRIARGESLKGLRLQDIDLRDAMPDLLTMSDLTGLVVLGGVVPDALIAHLRAAGALVFPPDPSLPVNPYRSRLYEPRELYAGLAAHGYVGTPDRRAYDWLLDPATTRDAYATVMRAIHDDSIGDALDERLDGHHVVGVMGGHDELRSSPAYADAAGLGRTLAEAGCLVLTGGGPGAMEAASLGGCATDAAGLRAALVELASVPSYRPDIGRWARTGLAVRDRYTDAEHRARVIGVPTWYYGHEPPHVFCAGIAKFFSNALREDTLLARCDAGVVVLPGAAGTVQEIFQAVTRMYYAASLASLPPLVLVGERQWTRDVPVWDLLTALAADRPMASAVHLVDSTEAAADVILGA
ncbi:LOG family protein [Allobranchiibius sp. CTAmp26]|uniref:LOG family protein n=1 Tax=Allobranchiibius sp. CTAmp26 TaxID=2815214 RepID=UPI0027DD7391|nr:Rossmann fold nucleotide-binding protein [Allobranchiibius sp. CTAmp26]